MTSSVSSKGQVTIPASIRERLDLSTGTSVEFIPTEGGVLLRKRFSTAEPLRGMLRHLAKGKSSSTKDLDRAVANEVERLDRLTTGDARHGR